MAIVVPAYGDMKYTLIPAGGPANLPYRIEQRVWVEGQSTYYDEDTKDFVTVDGEWATVNTLGHFDSPQEARDFMIARTTAATNFHSPHDRAHGAPKENAS